jgi:hydrogenase maturation protease
MILIIGYGNELRGDDAAGLRVAETVSRLNLPGTEALAVRQLTPELAEPLSQASAVLFVDAAVDGPPGHVEVTPCGPADLARPLGHLGDPDALLALAEAVFGRTPSAWLVKVRVQTTALGAPLSAAAEQGVRAAVAVVGELIRQLGPDRAAVPLAAVDDHDHAKRRDS